MSNIATLRESLTGDMAVQCLGDEKPRRLVISEVIFLQNGTPLCLITPRGTIYNWSNIISITKET